MSLDGLRAWIGEVERKLGVRTKVMLALAAIAIGIGGTAIYLAIDTRDNAVSEQDVQELQRELEARIGTGGTAGTATGVVQLESELRTLQAEVAELQAEGGASNRGKGAGSGDASGGESSGTGGASSTDAGDASTGGVGNTSDKLRELSERTEEQAE